MTHKFTIGNSTAYASSGRWNTILPDEGAVVSAERVPLELTDDVGWAASAWTFEGWIKIDAWPKEGGAPTTLYPLAGANAELILYNNGTGALYWTVRAWLEDSTGGISNYATTGVSAAPVDDGAWHHIAIQFEEDTRSVCTWLDGSAKAFLTGMGSSDLTLHHRRDYVGAMVNGFPTNVVIDPSTAPGVVSLDNLRFSPSARHVYSSGFTPPTAQYGDTAATARFVWPMRESATPYFIQSNFGDEWGIPRVSAHGDRYAGPWSVSWNASTAPVP